MQTIEDRVRAIMATVFGVEPSEIVETTSQDTLAKWDSLRQMNLIVALEEEFNITLGDEQVLELLTFPLVCTVIKEATG